MLLGVVFFVLLFGYAAVRAVRDEHVVVLRWPGKTFFLERSSEGQYRIFPVILFPKAVARYAALSVLAAIVGAFRRVRGWTTHKPVAAPSR
jgi:ATP/ADP translocase